MKNLSTTLVLSLFVWAEDSAYTQKPRHNLAVITQISNPSEPISELKIKLAKMQTLAEMSGYF